MFHGEAGIQRRDGLVPSNGLQSTEILTLGDIPTRSIKRGTSIYGKGWAADRFVVLRSGRVIGYRENADGKTLVEMHSAPSFLGYEALEGSREYRSTAIAFDESTVQYIDRQRLLVLIRDDTSFRMQLLVSILFQTKKRQDFLEAHAHGLAASIAFTLLDLAEEPTNEIHGVSHEIISSLSGYTRENVLLTMQRFRDRGLISYKHKGGIPSSIGLLQPDALRSVAETGRLPLENRSTEGIRPKA